MSNTNVNIYSGSESNVRLLNIYAFVVAATFILGIVFPWLVPSFISQTFKPLMIFICFSLLLIGNLKIKVNAVHFMTVLLLLYCTVILLGHNITLISIVEYISLMLYILMFLFSIMVNYNSKQMMIIMKSVFIASLIFAIIAAVSNPFIGTNMSRGSMQFLYNEINGNLIPYAILPGLVVGIHILLFGKNRNNLFMISSLAVMLYSILIPASRGPFIILLAILFLTSYSKIKVLITKARIFKILSFGIGIFGLLYIIIRYLPLSIKSRLLNFENYSDGSGRQEIYRHAWNLAKENMWIGGGFDLWSKTYTGFTHNLYLDLLISIGIIGTGIFIIIIVLLLFKLRNSILYSYLAIAVIESMVETSGVYTFWVPVIITIVLWDYCKRNGMSVQEFYWKNF